MELSVVVPVYCIAKNAIAFLPSAIDILRSKYTEFEVLIIIDQPDFTSEFQALLEMKETYDEIKIHSLNKNYGQHFATLCGYYLSKGDYIACVDEDMVQYIHEICKTNNYINYDAYYFYYNKDNMYNSQVRKYASNYFKLILNKIVCLEKHSTFRIISSKLRDKILLDKHYFLNLDVVISDITDNIGSTVIQEYSIKDDSSVYNYRKLIKIAFSIVYERQPLFMNLLVAFVIALLMFLITGNSRSCIIIFAAALVGLNIVYFIINRITKPTREKILRAVK